MKLYYTVSACSLVVRIIINELGLTAQYEKVDLANKLTASAKDYREINPKGQVPALQLDNGELLTEVSVILQYLADQAMNTRILPLPSDFNRYRILEWLNYIATELHKGMGPLFNPALDLSLREKKVLPNVMAKFHYIDERIQQHDYLVGEAFTLPDAYLFVMLRWANHFKLAIHSFKNLQRYYSRLAERPSIQLSLKEEELH